MAAKGRQVGEAGGLSPGWLLGRGRPVRRPMWLLTWWWTPALGRWRRSLGRLWSLIPGRRSPALRRSWWLLRHHSPPVDYRVQVVQTLPARVLLQASCNLITWQGNQACRPSCLVALQRMPPGRRPPVSDDACAEESCLQTVLAGPASPVGAGWRTGLDRSVYRFRAGIWL